MNTITKIKVYQVSADEGVDQDTINNKPELFIQKAHEVGVVYNSLDEFQQSCNDEMVVLANDFILIK